jgi:oligopeptidase A
MTNPLLENNNLPVFSQIKPEHVKPAITQAIEDCKNTVEELLAQQSYSWDSLIAPLEEVDDRLGKMWSPVSHMNSVVNSDELREAYESCLPLLSEYGTWLGQHQGLYEAYKAIAESSGYDDLSEAQQMAITQALRDFTLSGVALPEDKKKRYGDIKKRLSELASKFSNNVLDATLEWTKLVTDEADLAGLPESAIAIAAQTAAEREQQGWLFTLDIPSYLPVMTYADNAALREEMYRAYVTRASELGPNAGKFDNSKLMTETVKLRFELAQLLGFDSYADESLATKMAENPQQVLDFLNQLGEKSKAQGEQDVAELQAFAEQEFAVESLNPWDYAYYSEKLKQAKYAISDEELRPYFPENRVISGLFETVKRLFGLDIQQRDGVDVWHSDVKFYDIKDASGELRGSFYLDLYAREHKRGGAWMDDCVGRRITQSNQMQSPVAYLTCNFTQPVGDKPALFTHDEVITLFHEFGHGIHHMLTKIDVGAVSGINGVPWDAVELPSQFLENWCWTPEALEYISGHFETGEPLPQEMLDKMLAAKNFQSAMQMLRQLEFALFDFRLHHEYRGKKSPQIQKILDQVREQIAVVKAPVFNRFQHSFSHIFAGGYAAGYYSYKWAEVLSADAFSRFEEEGVFNAETGKSFLNNVLEMGGSKEPMELFKAFRGREPQIDALLRHSGIAA